MKKYKGFLSKVAKSGFYIILFLCISAIGISGYVMFLAKDALEDTKSEMSLESSLELPFPTENETLYDFGERIIIPPNVEEPEKEAQPAEEKKTIEPVPEKAVETMAEPKKNEAQAKPTEYTMAVNGAIAEPFSGKELVKSETMDDWRIHSGVDISAGLGTPVRAIADGTVVQTATDTMMGNVIKIEHADGIVSVYANLAEGGTLKVEDAVKAGDEIGKIGTSALAECLEEPHLHLEVLKNGENIDPLSLYPAGED